MFFVVRFDSFIRGTFFWLIAVLVEFDGGIVLEVFVDDRAVTEDGDKCRLSIDGYTVFLMTTEDEGCLLTSEVDFVSSAVDDPCLSTVADERSSCGSFKDSLSVLELELELKLSLRRTGVTRDSLGIS